MELALEMVVGSPPPIAVAAGAGGDGDNTDDIIGTDAVRIADAIATVASEQGVLVLMDLGSAILSSELALELLEQPPPRVRLSGAPFVEGLLAAVVLAASGAGLDEVERGAVEALSAKTSQLSGPTASDPTASDPDEAIDAITEVTLVNRDGLHARPAAAVVAAVAPFDARVTLTNLRTGRGPVSARTPIGLASLAARQFDQIRVEARGDDAQVAVDAVRDLIAAGFGEARPSVTGQASAAAASAGTGIGVSPGRVVGRAVVLPSPATEPDEGSTVAPADRSQQAARAEAAAAAVASDLRDLASPLAREAGDILAAIAAMARDPKLLAAIRSGVLDHGLTPERAVWQAIAAVSAQFASAGSVLAARVVDLEAVRDRIIARLTGRAAPGLPEELEPYVLVGHDLAATEAAVLDPRRCLAIVTRAGAAGSHAAILARRLGIPAVVGAEAVTTISAGDLVLVDGSTGEVVLNPGQA